MKDGDKTKEQLIEELVELRGEIAEFEVSEVDFMRGARVGEILIQMGCLTYSQLQRALQKQKEADILKHKRLGRIMMELGLITVTEMHSALEEQRIRLRHGA